MRKAEIEIYKDRAGGWRWRLKAGNGEIIADSGESYTRLPDVKKAILRVLEIIPVADVVMET
ncbi:DUF1508 domain-containing protein [bacterium]|nr:DUF1508 domain-containing protein [bacterium]